MKWAIHAIMTCILCFAFGADLLFAQKAKREEFHRIKQERLQEFRAKREASRKKQVHEIELKNASDVEIAMLKAGGAMQSRAHPDRFTVTEAQLQQIKTIGLPISLLQSGLRIEGSSFAGQRAAGASGAEDNVPDCNIFPVPLLDDFAFSFIDFTNSTYAGVFVKRFDIDYNIIPPFLGQVEFFLRNGYSVSYKSV